MIKINITQRINTIFISMPIVVVIAGCALHPSRQQIETADYGEYPNNYKALVIKFMEQRLKDPDSARYQFIGAPQKGWNQYGNTFGYVICANINAKNSFGGYTGNLLSYFMIKNGSIISNSNAGTYGDYTERSLCQDVFNEKSLNESTTHNGFEKGKYEIPKYNN